MYESDSEEETSSSSAVPPKRGRNGKAPLRAAPPALPVRAEESEGPFFVVVDERRGYKLDKTRQGSVNTARIASLRTYQDSIDG